MIKQGVEGRLVIKIEKVNGSFIVEAEDDIFDNLTFIGFEYMPKKKVLLSKESILDFVKKELDSYFKQHKKGEKND